MTTTAHAVERLRRALGYLPSHAGPGALAARLRRAWFPFRVGLRALHEAGRAVDELERQLAAAAAKAATLREQRDANRARYAEALGELRRRTGDYDWRPMIDRQS